MSHNKTIDGIRGRLQRL